MKIGQKVRYNNTNIFGTIYQKDEYSDDWYHVAFEQPIKPKYPNQLRYCVEASRLKLVKGHMKKKTIPLTPDLYDTLISALTKFDSYRVVINAVCSYEEEFGIELSRRMVAKKVQELNALAATQIYKVFSGQTYPPMLGNGDSSYRESSMTFWIGGDDENKDSPRMCAGQIVATYENKRLMLEFKTETSCAWNNNNHPHEWKYDWRDSQNNSSCSEDCKEEEDKSEVRMQQIEMPMQEEKQQNSGF